MALLGAPNENVDDGRVGVGHVYVRTGGEWSEAATLTSAGPAGGLGGYLGSEVALDAAGSRAFLCAPREGPTAIARVHVFERSGDVWSERRAFPDASFDTQCGLAVDADGERLVLAMVHGPDGPGFVRVFSRGVTSWREETPLETPPSEPWWRATEAALDGSGERVVVGIPTDMFGEPGDAYVYRLARAGTACASDADCPVGACVDAHCCNETCEAPCEACSVAAGAVEDGRCGPIAGDDPLCDDGDSCTRDRCEPGLGCTSDALCEDGGSTDATVVMPDVGSFDASPTDAGASDARTVDEGDHPHASDGCSCRATRADEPHVWIGIGALVAWSIVRPLRRRVQRRSRC